MSKFDVRTKESLDEGEYTPQDMCDITNKCYYEGTPGEQACGSTCPMEGTASKDALKRVLEGGYTYEKAKTEMDMLILMGEV